MGNEIRCQRRRRASGYVNADGQRLTDGSFTGDSQTGVSQTTHRLEFPAGCEYVTEAVTTNSHADTPTDGHMQSQTHRQSATVTQARRHIHTLAHCHTLADRRGQVHPDRHMSRQTMYEDSHTPRYPDR